MKLLGRLLLTVVESLLFTAGVLTFLAALLGGDVLIALIGALAAVGGALAFAMGVRKTPPERRPGLWLQGVAALLTAVLTFGWVAQAASGSSRASPMRNASASLKTLASAEIDFRMNDRDNNGVLDFWVGDVAGLYLLAPQGGTELVKLIEISVAAADAAPSPASVQAHGNFFEFSPKAGYLYRALTQDADGLPYDEGKGRSQTRFAFVAYPKTYGKEYRRTLLINEENTIWWKDTAGKPVASWPKDLKADGWAKLD